MNTSRLCSVYGASGDIATHQRVADLLRERIESRPGWKMTIRDEWIAEETVQALLDENSRRLRDGEVNLKRYKANMAFLAQTSWELPGERGDAPLGDDEVGPVERSATDQQAIARAVPVGNSVKITNVEVTLWLADPVVGLKSHCTVTVSMGDFAHALLQRQAEQTSMSVEDVLKHALLRAFGQT